jgi:hypothetical protein
MFDWWRRWRERRERTLWEEVPVRPRPPSSAPDGLSPAVRELVEIGMAGHFLTADGHDQRTRQIGQSLYDQGGHAAMIDAYDEVAALLPYRRRGLEMAWDGIGDWQG